MDVFQDDHILEERTLVAFVVAVELSVAMLEMLEGHWMVTTTQLWAQTQ